MAFLKDLVLKVQSMITAKDVNHLYDYLEPRNFRY